MKNLLLNTIISKGKLFIIVVTLTVLMIVMYVAIYPTLSGQSAELEKMLTSFPKEVWGAMGITGVISFSTFEGYFSMEFYSITWQLVSIILMVSMGISFIAGEIDAGTMHLLLANPISRIKLFIVKYLSGMVLLASFCLITILSTVMIMAAYSIHIDFLLYARVLAMELAFCSAGFGLMMLISTVLERGKGTGIAIGLFLGMYFLNALSALNEKLELLQYFSLFHYADFMSVFSTNSLNFGNITVLLVIAIFSTGLSVVIFNRRDI